MKPKTTPAAQRLTIALVEANAPKEIVDLARDGMFGDFTSPYDMPITELVVKCESLGLHDIASRAKNGEFDGQ